jgi:putative hydrolase of the HAD superfamily
MKHFKNITTLIFDFGGVLINLDRNLCIQNFKQLGVQNLEKVLNDYAQSGFFEQLERGQINAEKFREEIRNMTSNPLTDSQIDLAWCSFLQDIPTEKLDLLIELRKKYRILLLSNTNSIHIQYSLDRFTYKDRSLCDYFDKCYLSYEMGMAKPDAEIFEALLSDAQLKAGECLLLDDGAKNIEQAHKLGIQTYLVKEKEDLSFLLNAETFIAD